MKAIKIDPNLCIGCEACYKACKEGSIIIEDKKEGVRVIRFSGTCPEACISCKDICPTLAISFASVEKEEPFELTFEMAECKECGRPFGTEKAISFLEGRLKDFFDVKRLCIQCKQKMAINWF